ncbi:helix-turn-helix domain containing protein [Phaeobacter gallaeciensis]|uniref:Helix-turn-helix domain containing protein n=1 Tax=Phaeobacter gallaeciensis TaxID=60890 RepID=A0ABD4XGS3_9RHOB|nr:TetR/AcrR family transcriptional regulator [Phaeobacter gallaeciensis]MDE4147092.1 helix-turn-helix domain containing protein [Phaeobacter gallaeciensis]MDE4159731.1 helix-turn-helix domain containing protein [Phaeobacter gallaeciensis]MDE4163951.1 helix-turn-helix domain containing protein [Phaeobacter gallaeciensis]MDE4168185.1 helix-turn-helix domain containing protein [Phaeobacter gallaeciensis]MDE4172407.1 helix-turn-helix domain containing protein [Phaeobacter gallaeciensis]
MYKSPKQLRAQETERAFLSVFRQLLAERGFARTSLEDIATRSEQTRSAFLSRFGSKKAALFLLFDEYCAAVSDLMRQISRQVQDLPDAKTCVHLMSASFERRLIDHFASNRAMHELYLEDLQVNERTQRIFMELVELMRLVQRHHLRSEPCTDAGAFSAAQVLVTTNYNYVLKAMPGLARDPSIRHEMIARMVVEALKF